MMKSFVFLIPFIAWFVAGSLKFAVNSLRSKSLNTKAIGLGSWPSNHSTIVAATASYAGFHEGFDSSIFVVAVGLAFIVVIDARDLRNHLGAQAKAILTLDSKAAIRTRLGHTGFEILSGLALGALIGFLVEQLVRISA